LSPPAIRPCHCLLAAIRPFRRVSPPFVSPGQPRPRSGSRILVAWAAQRGDAYRWTRGAVKWMAHHAVSRKWKWDLG
jgi:hypothetical protein